VHLRKRSIAITLAEPRLGPDNRTPAPGQRGSVLGARPNGSKSLDGGIGMAPGGGN
jgi:hypothetical protein